MNEYSFIPQNLLISLRCKQTTTNAELTVWSWIIGWLWRRGITLKRWYGQRCQCTT